MPSGAGRGTPSGPAPLPNLAVGWYRNVSDPNQLRHWNGERWTEALRRSEGGEDRPDPPEVGSAAPTESESAAPTEVESAARTKKRRGRRAKSVITVAEALVAALVLVAVVAFVRSASGPPHPVGVSQATGKPTRTSVVVPRTTVPVPSVPSVDAQVAAWWSMVGESRTAALIADLNAIGQAGTGAGSPPAACSALSADTAAAVSAPPAPFPAIEREWQLTASTSGRVAAACESGRTRALAGDLGPAEYTINDLSTQIRPYLSR